MVQKKLQAFQEMTWEEKGKKTRNVIWFIIEKPQHSNSNSGSAYLKRKFKVQNSNHKTRLLRLTDRFFDECWAVHSGFVGFVLKPSN